MSAAATVYCIIPVHNRLEMTRHCVEQLAAQDYPALQIVIVDDGSTDGTSDYLAECKLPNLTALKGSGDLFWGGAMRLGIDYVTRKAEMQDYLLMLNDDVSIEKYYVDMMVDEALTHEMTVIGSAQREAGSGRLLGCGCEIDYWTMRVLPVQGECRGTGVDALPGRGALFPMEAIKAAGNINVRRFPHYLGDLEYSARINELGWKIYISEKADIYTSAESSDEKLREQGLKTEYLSFRSKNNLAQRLWFFSLRGPVWLRFWAIPRYGVVGGWRLLKRVFS